VCEAVAAAPRFAMCCAATPGIFPSLSLSLTLARKLLHALSLFSFLSQSPRQCRATAARHPASGVAIIRQGPRSGIRSGGCKSREAEAGVQSHCCAASGQRRRDHPPRAAQRKGRGGGCRSRAAEAGVQSHFCAASGQRRRDYPPRAAQRKGRGGGCR
jgi:hypothetical protein